MNLASQHIQSLITNKSKELGFFKIGFAEYEVLEDESQQLEKWLDSGYDADMEWIKRGFEKRRDIQRILPDAESVISLAYNYFTPFHHNNEKPKISRYAWGKDYHKILKPKLKELSKFIEEICHYEEQNDEVISITKAYVDDGPVMDKVWAQKSGIGWMGKHTNIINPEYGSWFFICNIITNIRFNTYYTPVEDLCGSCSLCISACPTGAITDEYVVDANKCISYQTIENRGEIPEEINLDGWIFGCDVCQDVCPYNSPKYNHITSDKNFYPLPVFLSPPSKGDLGGFDIQTSSNQLHSKLVTFAAKQQLESLSEEEFTKIFTGSPVKRTKHKGWKRNLEKIKG
jgi:epoxyqueuosine reductase